MPRRLQERLTQECRHHLREGHQCVCRWPRYVGYPWQSWLTHYKVSAEYKCIVKAREILPYLNLIGFFINLKSGLGIDKHWSDIDLCNISDKITNPHNKYAANKKLEKHVHKGV